MQVDRLHIESDPSEETEHPWFNFWIDPDEMTVEFRQANGCEGASRLVGKKKHSLTLQTTSSDDGPVTEPHVLAVKTDGTWEFVPLSRQQAIYYAHLAFYYPADDRWEVLYFEAPPSADEAVEVDDGEENEGSTR